MAWYWIVLIVIGYLICGAILTGIVSALGNGVDEDDKFAMVLMWPLFFPVLLVACICHLIIDFIENL